MDPARTAAVWSKVRKGLVLNLGELAIASGYDRIVTSPGVNGWHVCTCIHQGLVLNLGELAIASGYDRGMLARMELPLQAGKISLEDFQRIMRKRQDRAEREAPSHAATIPFQPGYRTQAEKIQSDYPHGLRKKKCPAFTCLPSWRFMLTSTL